MHISRFFFRISSYWNYLLHAQNNAYIHSPFVFDFYQNVVLGGQILDQDIISYKTYLASNNTKLHLNTIGAKKGNTAKYSRSVASHFQLTKTSKKEGALLFRIVSHYAIQNAIELGTSLGVSSLYIAKGNSHIKLKTIDFNTDTSEVLDQFLKNRSIQNIEIIIGTFEEQVARVAEQIKPIQLAYIDGDHSYEATIKNLDTISAHLDKTFFIVLDDIRWSKGMWRAWKQLIKNPLYNFTFDMGSIGVLIRIPNNATKQHYYLR